MSLSSFFTVAVWWCLNADPKDERANQATQMHFYVGKMPRAVHCMMSVQAKEAQVV